MNIAPLQNSTQIFTFQRQAGAGMWGRRIAPPKSWGHQNRIWTLFLEGGQFHERKKMTRQIGSSYRNPASSRGPMVSKRPRWLFISPPLALVANWLLIWGTIWLQGIQSQGASLFFVQGPRLLYFFYLDLEPHLSPRAPWSPNGPH